LPDPFIDRDDLGAKLNQDLSASDAALIAIDSACDVCRTLSEQDFNQAIEDEIVLDGSGTEILLLPQYPVGAITSVSEDKGDPLVEDADFVVNAATGALVRTPSSQGYISNNFSTKPWVVWNLGRQNIAITYDHGWDYPDIPRDVRMVALAIAERFFLQTAGVTSESLGSRSVSYKSEATDVTANELRILLKYKRY
jgi:predicted lactoylglutathione lyase